MLTILMCVELEGRTRRRRRATTGEGRGPGGNWVERTSGVEGRWAMSVYPRPATAKQLIADQPILNADRDDDVYFPSPPPTLLTWQYQPALHRRPSSTLHRAWNHPALQRTSCAIFL